MAEDEFLVETLPALMATNLNSNNFPWNGVAPFLIKRWELPIPVKVNGESRAITAMNEIERQLNMEIFDRKSIDAVPDSEVSRGLIISVGTAYAPPGSNPQHACGSVSAEVNSGHWPSPSATENGVMSYRLYISLDNAFCEADLEVVIHEFGHAMGMGAHFEGFGDGPPISDLFWNVLRTIYANTPGTPMLSIRHD